MLFRKQLRIGRDACLGLSVLAVVLILIEVFSPGLIPYGLAVTMRLLGLSAVLAAIVFRVRAYLILPPENSVRLFLEGVPLLVALIGSSVVAKVIRPGEPLRYLIPALVLSVVGAWFFYIIDKAVKDFDD